jgi:hypothetical protein
MPSFSAGDNLASIGFGPSYVWDEDEDWTHRQAVGSTIGGDFQAIELIPGFERRFTLPYGPLSEPEVATVRAFIAAQKGSIYGFTLTRPLTSEVLYLRFAPQPFKYTYRQINNNYIELSVIERPA